MAEPLNVINTKEMEKEDKLRKVRNNLKDVKNIFVVMSGKGGVGKSTVSAALAAGLAARGNYVGLADCDMHGPSIPMIFGLEGAEPDVEDGMLVPVTPVPSLKLMSIAFLLPDRDQPVIWRGPAKMGAIKQFFEDVAWGNLDYLIVDLPPGTGDEPLSVLQQVPGIDGAFIVTIPQDVALASVRKSLSFLNKMEVRPLGIIDNMDGLVCPHCHETIDVFGSSGVEKASQDFSVPILAKLPLDPSFSKAEESGKIIEWMMADSPWKKAFDDVLDEAERLGAEKKDRSRRADQQKSMKRCRNGRNGTRISHEMPLVFLRCTYCRNRFRIL